MSKNDGLLNPKILRFAYEVLLALNLSFATVSVVELKSESMVAPFLSVELSVNRLLHIPQTDFIRGYIAFAFSSTTLALVVWLGLRLSAGTKITKGVLRFLGGTVILLLPAVFWLYAYQESGWPFGWPYRGAPFELILALVSAQLYASEKWHFPALFGVALLAAHYGYWFWMPAGNYFAPNYSGPIAPILGFCAAMAWALYVKREKQASPDVLH
jgi:hypothetical protein